MVKRALAGVTRTAKCTGAFGGCAGVGTSVGGGRVGGSTCAAGLGPSPFDAPSGDRRWDFDPSRRAPRLDDVVRVGRERHAAGKPKPEAAACDLRPNSDAAEDPRMKADALEFQYVS